MEDEEYAYDPEKKSVAGKVFKILFYGTSFLIFALFIIRFIGACGAGIGTQILLDEKAAAFYPGGEVIRVDFPTDEIKDGSVMPQYAVYLKETKNFQLTLRIRTDHLPPSGEGCGYRVELTGLYGEEKKVFPLYAYTADERFGYRYLRVSFDGVDLERAAELVINLWSVDGTLALSHQVYNPDMYLKAVSPSEKDFRLL